MDQAIDELEANLSDSQGMLLYFSGHGCENQGSTHMMPIKNSRDHRII